MTNPAVYTSCVLPEDFKGFPNLDVEKAALIIGAIGAPFTGGASLLVSLAGAASAGEELLRYILYEKLVCLGPDICVVGHVVSFEPPHTIKSPFTRGIGASVTSLYESIDDDLSINIGLSPYGQDQWKTAPGQENAMPPRISHLGAAWTDPTQDALGPRPQLSPHVAGREAEHLPAEWLAVDRWPETLQRWWWGRGDVWSKAIERLSKGTGAGSLSASDKAQMAGFTAATDIDKPAVSAQLRKRLLEDAFRDLLGRFYGYFEETRPETGRIPIMHAEIEGARPYAMLRVLEEIGSLGTATFGGGGVCDFEILGFSIGRVVCAVVAAIAAPFLLPALLIAYLAAEDGRQRDVLMPGSGEVGDRDGIVVTGRHTYDSGHYGWNEIHPVLRLQKIPNLPNGESSLPSWASTSNPDDPGWAAKQQAVKRDIEQRAKEWCDAVSGAPPPTPVLYGKKGGGKHRHGTGRGGRRDPARMSATQQATYDAQLRPENRWTIHPLIDGCAPTAGAHGPASIR